MYRGKARTGEFVPKHPEKYIGTKTVLEYRSSWEMRAMEFFDNNVKVVGWSYEEIKIQYLKPQMGGGFTQSYYIPDVYVEYYDRDGVLQREVLEIKPKAQTAPPTSKNAKKKIYESYTWAVNKAKWLAAERWCEFHQLKFRLITETSIFNA